MPQQNHPSDYSRYFNPGQKVYLVKVSIERNCEIYESLSGVVASRGVNILDLLVANGGLEINDDLGNETYKLTSEVLGSGIQVLANLTGKGEGNSFQFCMHGALEMFQRRIVPRIGISAPICQRCGNFPLAIFKKEWKRVREHMLVNAELPGIVLQETEIKLSAGGIGLTVDAARRPTSFSMILISLDEGTPICAIAEIIWEKEVDELLRCGFRFIHILKADQERINRFINDSLRKSGGTHLDYNRNWVLVDKMMNDIRKPE